ncbi:alpha/beta hydrolase family protein [Gloeobacter kilaueensis]|nr:alpha/beta fold hydrolase [Gloeobacter kilaueensis]
MSEVGVIEALELVDGKRSREVPVKIFYPSPEGVFPVVLFSHGSGGSKDSYDYLGRYLAAHGYVSVHPTHYGSDTSVYRTGGLRGVIETNDDPVQWLNRVEDMRFLLDELGSLNRQVEELVGKLDTGCIGIGGHSFGAFTATMLAGALVDLPGAPASSFRDERAQAFVTISPQGSGLNGLRPNSWRAMTKPVLTITGSEDRGRGGQPPEWRMEPFYNMPPGDKYLIVIEGAPHFGFSGQAPGEGEASGVRARLGGLMRAGAARRGARPAIAPEQIHAYTATATLAFWDAYLKANRPAQEYLRSGRLEAESVGQATIAVR